MTMLLIFIAIFAIIAFYCFCIAKKLFLSLYETEKTFHKRIRIMFAVLYTIFGVASLSACCATAFAIVGVIYG